MNLRKRHTYNGDGLDIDRCKYVMVSKTPFGRIRFRNVDLTEGFQTVNAPDVKVEGETFCELPLSAEERVKIAEGIDAHTLRLH